MVDGGRSAAKGFLYQYTRTVEALLDAAESGSVGAVHVEGRRPATKEAGVENIDYEFTDHAGRTLVAVQVKGRGPGGTLGPTDIRPVTLRRRRLPSGLNPNEIAAVQQLFAASK